MANIENILKNLNQNQLKQINDFLSTPRGWALKKKINASDKQRLLRELSKADTQKIEKKLGGLSPQELAKIINSL